MSRNKEAEYTAWLLASLERAGVVGVTKIPDPVNVRRPGGGTMVVGDVRNRKCDLMGMLSGGRHLSIEAKQLEIDHKGVPAFRASMLAPHQHEHLQAIAKHGGHAAVALFAWQSRKEWRLYWWPYWRLRAMWAASARGSLSRGQMAEQPYLSRIVWYEDENGCSVARTHPNAIRRQGWDLAPTLDAFK